MATHPRLLLLLGLFTLGCAEVNPPAPLDPNPPRDAGADVDLGGSSDTGPRDDATVAPDGGAGADADAPSGDASVTDRGAPETDEVVVYTDLTLPGHPHGIDLYLPSGAERVVIFLHGGGGTKETAAARELGARLDDPPEPTPVPDRAWMLSNRTAWVFPQGQHIPGARLARTWDNYMMLSGVDDVAFLQALTSALRAGTLAPSVPGFGRVYLAGHSNGGLMTNRLWCESTPTFDGYAGVAGPPSTDLLPGGPHPCAPSAVRPFLGIIGSADTVLQTANNWDGDWAVNRCLQNAAGPAMPNPNVANEERFHREFRVPFVCGGPTSAPTMTPQATTWSDCQGQVRLIRVEGADHCVSPTNSDLCLGGGQGGGCSNALDVQLGTRVRDVLVDFFRASEP